MIAGVLLLVAVWLVTSSALKARFLDPAWLFLGLFGLLIVARASVIAVGLDRPFPTEHFAVGYVTHDVVFRASVAASVFLVAALAGHSLVLATAPKPSSLLPFAGARTLPLDTHRRVVLFLGLICSAILVWVLATSGGLAQSIFNQKFARSGGASIQLRSIGVVTASLSIALALRPQVRGWRQFATVGVAVVGALTAFAWGARDGAVFPLLTAMLFWSRNRGGSVQRRKSQRILRLVAGIGVVAVGTVGLRIVRDLLAKSELESSLVGQSLVRQISVAANLVQFDAALLGFRDWPQRYDFRGFEGLTNGAQNYVPQFLGGPSQAQVNGNVVLAQIYEPARTNGWPHTALGEWWIAGGWTGVVVGGLIAGAVLAWIRASYDRSATDPLQLMMAVMVCVVVFQFGIREVTFSRFVTICGPLLVLDRISARSAAGSIASEIRSGRTVRART